MVLVYRPQAAAGSGAGNRPERVIYAGRAGQLGQLAGPGKPAIKKPGQGRASIGAAGGLFAAYVTGYMVAKHRTGRQRAREP